MVQYYTLEQAAQILRVSPDQLKEMARRKEVSSFRDGANLRFRAQEIDELARKRGLGSDPDLQLGEAPPKSGGASSSARRRAQQQAAAGEEDVSGTYDLTIDEPGPRSGSGRGTPGSGKGKPASPRPSQAVPKSPPPSPRPAAPSPRPGKSP